MKWLPVLVNAAEYHYMIFGGGQVATRKAKTLLKADCKVTIVSPAISTELSDLLSDTENNSLFYVQEQGLLSHIQGHSHIIAATNSEATNAEIIGWANSLSLPVNAVDNPDASDFIFPAVIERDSVTVAISTGGVTPALTRYLRNVIDSALPTRVGELASFLGRGRKKVRSVIEDSKERQRHWRTLMGSAVPDQVLAGRLDTAAELSEALLQQFLSGQVEKKGRFF